MKDKNGNKRKVSVQYISSFIGFGIMFIAFFLVLALHYRIFDKYKTAEIIKINGITDPNIVHYSGTLEITLNIDGEEYITYFEEPTRSGLTHAKLRVGDKIQYSAGNPDKIFPDRKKEIIFLSCVEGVIIALLIGTTIYEIKKGF